MWVLARSTLQRCPKNLLKIAQRPVRGTNFNQPLIRTHSEETKWSQLIKPMIFTAGFGFVAINGAFIYKYEEKRAKSVRQKWDDFYNGNLPKKEVYKVNNHAQ